MVCIYLSEHNIMNLNTRAGKMLVMAAKKQENTIGSNTSHKDPDPPDETGTYKLNLKFNFIFPFSYFGFIMF